MNSNLAVCTNTHTVNYLFPHTQAKLNDNNMSSDRLGTIYSMSLDLSKRPKNPQLYVHTRVKAIKIIKQYKKLPRRHCPLTQLFPRALNPIPVSESSIFACDQCLIKISSQ